MGDAGELAWFELLTNDTAKAGTFYSELFGYKLKPFGDDGTYTVFMALVMASSPAFLRGRLAGGETQIGGIMTAPMEGIPNYWGLYFSAEDVDKVHDKVKAAGGQAMMEPTDMPEVGRLAVLADPQGAAFGVIKNPQGA